MQTVLHAQQQLSTGISHALHSRRGGAAATNPRTRQGLRLQLALHQPLAPTSRTSTSSGRQCTCWRQRAPVQARAGPETGAQGTLLGSPLVQPLVRLVGTPVYLAMELGVLLAVLALTDAAYSGDWSRIGAIPADIEPALQKLTIIVWSLHGVCGVAAASIATGKGRSGSSAALKGLLFGAMHVFAEAVLAPAGAGAQPTKDAAAPQR